MSTRTKLIIGISAGVTVVIAVVAGIMISKSNARKAQAEAVERVAKKLATLADHDACNSVQDHLATLRSMDAGAVVPTLPANPKFRQTYAAFLEIQRNKAGLYRRIAGAIQENKLKAITSDVEEAKEELRKLGDEALAAPVTDLNNALDQRVDAVQSYISGWKRLETETNSYAEIIEKVFVQGTGNPQQFAEFHFAKEAPVVRGTCTKAQNAAKEEIETKLAALKALVAKK